MIKNTKLLAVPETHFKSIPMQLTIFRHQITLQIKHPISVLPLKKTSKRQKQSVP